MPIASGRRSGATPPEMRARESGSTPAAPNPCSARAAMSWAGSVLSAAKTDPSAEDRDADQEDRAPAEAVAERRRR